MLSDGAGAAVLGAAPKCSELCFRIEWIELPSFAGQFEPCMYVGPPKNGNKLESWLDYSSYDLAADAGAINLRQDIRMLDEVVRHAVDGLLRVTKNNNLDPRHVDWLAVHCSSNVFRDKSHELAAAWALTSRSSDGLPILVLQAMWGLHLRSYCWNNCCTPAN
jgi:3-oxoacyl-[acyl-carrier-protein] synthase-3